MSDAPPVVSVVMAAYNGAALIEQTLASLAAQTLPDWEAIVVDDCSTDDTLAVLRGWTDPRVRVIAAEANGGPVVARNRAFADARGRYVAGLDQDDLCRPQRFARQVACLDAEPDVVAVGTAARELVDGAERDGLWGTVTTPALIDWLLLIENPLVWSSMMVRGEVVRRLDVFTRPELLFAEDFDLYHRLRPLGRIMRLDEELVLYRRHAGGASQRYAQTMIGHAAQVLAASYQPLLGERSARAAALVAAHLLDGCPVPDRAVLAELGHTLGTLQAAYLAARRPDAAAVRLIRWETARRWARVARIGLRAGTLALGDAMAVRPDHLGLGHAGMEELLWSSVIGGARRAGLAGVVRRRGR